MTATSHHALVIHDRGQVHVHRYRPRCACGHWTGTNARRKRGAIAQYRAHVRVVTSWCYLPEPRPCTPAERLPELLRAGA